MTIQKAPLDKDGKPMPTITLEKYIETARDSMIANSETWEGVIDRIGRWVDFKGAYRTMNKDYMESGLGGPLSSSIRRAKSTRVKKF